MGLFNTRRRMENREFGMKRRRREGEGSYD
jgi:hypothetical protein